MAHAVRRIESARSTATLERLGGIAAAVTAVLLLLGLVGLMFQQSAFAPTSWLVVLLQMNSGTGSLPADSLHIINPLDIAILALVGLTFLGLWPVLGPEHRIWIAIAIALPFVGIAVLLVTGLAGRSAVMGAGLVISVLLYVRGRRRVVLALLGLLANALLLAGDFGTGVLPGGPLGVAIGIGYVLLLAWYALLSVGLLGASKKALGTT